MANAWTEDQIAIFHEAFDVVDKDSDGVVFFTLTYIYKNVDILFNVHHLMVNLLRAFLVNFD